MKITQIQVPNDCDKAMRFLEELQKDDVYLVFFVHQAIVDRYKLDHASRIRPFDLMWNKAVGDEMRVQSIVYNLSVGRTALVRIE